MIGCGACFWFMYLSAPLTHNDRYRMAKVYIISSIHSIIVKETEQQRETQSERERNIDRNKKKEKYKYLKGVSGEQLRKES